MNIKQNIIVILIILTVSLIGLIVEVTNDLCIGYNPINILSIELFFIVLGSIKVLIDEIRKNN